jgi:hypothetical protein
MKRVVWLVEESDRISFQVRDSDLTGTQVAHRRLPAVLPIFMMRKIAEYQTDEKRIFLLD